MEGTSTSDPTRGVFAGGKHNYLSVLQNVIDFVEISTTGNALDFGDLHAPNSSHDLLLTVTEVYNGKS